MTSARPVLTRGRRWLTSASFALALAVVVGSQVHSSIAHADASPAAFIGPPAAVTAQAVAAPSPVPADTATVGIAPVRKPAKAPKKATAPNKPKAPRAAGDICSGP